MAAVITVPAAASRDRYNVVQLMPRISTGRSDAAQQQHPADCQCCRAPAPAQQSLDELAFTKSACAAAKSGDLEKLRRLIDKQPACVHSDGCGGDSGHTPLLYAAREGHLDAARLLLRHGADVHACTRAGGTTALHRAAFMGHMGMVELLMRHGARADAQDADGQTPLHKGASRGYADIAVTLLKAAPGASLLTDRNGKTAAESATGSAARLFTMGPGQDRHV